MNELNLPMQVDLTGTQEKPVATPQTDFQLPTPSAADNVSAPVALSEDQRRADVQAVDDYQKKQEETAPGLIDGFGAALVNEWSISWAAMDDGGKPDPDFTMTPDLHKQLTEGVPEEHWGYFDDVTNEEQAWDRRHKMLMNMEITKDIGKMGLSGVGVSFAAAMLDPVAIGAAVATDGLAAPYLLALKARRVQRALVAGTAAAAGSAAGEAALVNYKPTGEAEDILHAAIGGFVLGGGIQALRKIPDLDAEATKLEHELIRMQQAMDAPDESIQSMGAMKADAFDTPLRADSAERIQDAKATPKAGGGILAKTRFDLTGRLMNSENPLVRQLAAKLSPDAVGAADGSVVKPTASEYQSILDRTFNVKFQKTIGAEFEKWAKEQNLSVYQRATQRDAFMEAVGKAVRDPNADVHPTVRAAAKHHSQIMKEWLDIAKRPDGDIGEAQSVKGFDNVEFNEDYVMRKYDTVAMSKYHTDGEAGLQNLFKQAIMRAQDDIEEAVAEKLAKWHVTSVQGHAFDTDMFTMRAMSGEDKEGLQKMLTDETDLSEDEINAVLGRLEKPNDGAHSRAKRRLFMDETTVVKLRDKETGELKDVSIQSLLKSNVEELFNTYSRQMSSAVAMARTGYRSKGEFETELKKIEQSSDEITAQYPNYTKAQLESDLNNLRAVHANVTGGAVYRNASGTDVRHSKWGRAINTLMGYNFIRVMNQVGVAQIPEIANIVGQVGYKTLFKAIPGYRAFIRDARKGKVSDEFLDELEDVLGMGTDYLRHVPANRYDDFGTAMNPRENKKWDQVDATLEHGKKITSLISGMTGINVFLQRTATTSVVHHYADMAMGIKPFKANRAHADGLDEAMVKRIGEQLKKHAKSGKGEFSPKEKLRTLNMDKWEPEVANAFKMAVYRRTRKMVQEQDAGDLPMWASHPAGKMVMQFRTFMLAAYPKQTMYQLQMRDWQAFSSIMHSMFIAGLAYTAHTYSKAQGREDKQEYLDKHLSMEEIVKASIQRTGASSLVPMAMDSVVTPFTNDPVFSARTTGLDTNLLGNPTYDLVMKAGGDAVSAMRLLGDPDYQLSKENMRNFYNVLPFQNAFGVINLQQETLKGLPSRSTSDY